MALAFVPFFTSGDAAMLNDTDISVCSHALVMIGHSPINSLSENPTADELFPGIYKAFLSARRWTFASGKVALSRLVDAPLNEYTYAFQLPTEMLKLDRVYPSGVRYRIYGDKLYANVREIEIDYRYQVDLSIVPADAVKALEYKVAADLAIPITRKADIANEYEGKFKESWFIAATADSQQQPADEPLHQPFISARY
jgi:hypothetical protein